jgi:hypothetical protein
MLGELQWLWCTKFCENRLISVCNMMASGKLKAVLTKLNSNWTFISFIFNFPFLLWIWSSGQKFPDFIRISHFHLVLRVFPAQLLSMIYTHFRCSFISADSVVLNNTPIDLFLNISTCYSQWLHKTCIIQHLSVLLWIFSYLHKLATALHSYHLTELSFFPTFH